ncbi:MAG: hypothetical protein JWM44_3325 [Bacilli bacterium]|nr:hypothetical protein [Bacilli bacterium]
MIFQITSDPEMIQAAERLLYSELFEPLQLDHSARQQLKIPGDDYYFVCTNNQNEVIGVMLLVRDHPYNEIRHAAVSQKYRNHGIGWSIWQEVYRFGLEREIASIELYSRNSAIKFWTKLGFVEISDWMDKDMFKEHDIRFKKMKFDFKN